MSKLLSNIAFSFFLLFQTISLADEDAQKEHTETNITAENSKEKTEPQDALSEAENPKEKAEPQDALSEAEKEALAAEEAELREAGIVEEPVAE